MDRAVQAFICGRIEEFIAERGYYSAMTHLVGALYELAYISLADPNNPEKRSDVEALAVAVRAAIAIHEFQDMLSAADHAFAEKMGVSLG